MSGIAQNEQKRLIFIVVRLLGPENIKESAKNKQTYTKYKNICKQNICQNG